MPPLPQATFFTIRHYRTSTYGQTSLLWTPPYYLTISPCVHFRYEMVECTELAIIISYSTSMSGIVNCYNFKNALKISRILSDFICKNNRFLAFLKFLADMYSTTFREHGTMAHIP